MNYVQAALKGDFKEAAKLSFDCISCGLCAMRCPAEIVPYNIALLARRIYGKYLLPKSREVERVVREIEQGKYGEELQKLGRMRLEELKKMYEERVIK